MANWLMLDMKKRYTRPIVTLDGGISCMIDTGADTPVWTTGSDTIERELNARKVEDKHYILSGFGKDYEVAYVYEIPELKLACDNDSIVFKGLLVACTMRPTMIARLILPASALSHMNYLIHNVGIETPRVEIEHDKNEYYVRPKYSSIDGRILQRVYSFATES